MSETILDPMGIVGAAAAGGFRRRQPFERRPDGEAPAETPDPLDMPPPQGGHKAPPLPDPAPAEAFTTAMLASRLLPPTQPPTARTPEDWTPPPSGLHLTDREV